jgi:hypothetical protein
LSFPQRPPDKFYCTALRANYCLKTVRPRAENRMTAML